VAEANRLLDAASLARGSDGVRAVPGGAEMRYTLQTVQGWTDWMAAAELIRQNLAEEENPAGSHPKLWRDFAAAIGVGEDDITCCPALPGTQAVVQKFREICGDRPVAEAVAALYAYESQVPEIATTKMDGLKKFYGVTEPEGLAYFEVHEEADKAHRAAWRGWLEEHASGDEEEILKTTNEALDALWGALDAVHCERQEVRM